MLGGYLFALFFIYFFLKTRTHVDHLKWWFLFFLRVIIHNYSLDPFSFPLQALDTFNTAVVSPIYYVMFTSLTILASVIMFKV